MQSRDILFLDHLARHKLLLFRFDFRGLNRNRIYLITQPTSSLKPHPQSGCRSLLWSYDTRIEVTSRGCELQRNVLEILVDRKTVLQCLNCAVCILLKQFHKWNIWVWPLNEGMSTCWMQWSLPKSFSFGTFVFNLRQRHGSKGVGVASWQTKKAEQYIGRHKENHGCFVAY